MWCEGVTLHHPRFHAGAKSLFHLLERFEHLLVPVSGTPSLTRCVSHSDLSYQLPHNNNNNNERVVRQRSCPPEEIMAFNFDLLAYILHSNPTLESPQKTEESPREEPLLLIEPKKTSKQSQPSCDEGLYHLQQLAGGDVL